MKVIGGGELFKRFVVSCLPISSGSWWFITAYFFLFFFIPAINKIISLVSLKSLCLLTLLFWVFYYCFDKISLPYDNLRIAILFYLIGAILRQAEFKINKNIFLAVFIFFWLFEWACKIFLLNFSSGNDSINLLLDFARKAFTNAVLYPVCAASLFEYFRRLNIKQSAFINAVSSTTFGIYIIHDSVVMRDFLWNKVFCCLQKQYTVTAFPLLMILSCLLVFAVCSVIDFARQKFLEKPFLNFIQPALKKLKNL